MVDSAPFMPLILQLFARYTIKTNRPTHHHHLKYCLIYFIKYTYLFISMSIIRLLYIFFLIHSIEGILDQKKGSPFVDSEPGYLYQWCPFQCDTFTKFRGKFFFCSTLSHLFIVCPMAWNALPLCQRNRQKLRKI